MPVINRPSSTFVDGLLIQFNKNRSKAVKRYKSFVIQGIINGPIWEQVKRQVYLGDDAFIDKIQGYMEQQKNDIQIPKIQKRGKALSLEEYQKIETDRDTAIFKAYSSGAYSYNDLGKFFGLHFVTIGKIVRRLEGKG
ncbi:MAG: hypothetical protein ISR69_01800 [Gammaproteobacteria bacterium]|nr:hypothetical protein [Gammaproteobacteria bacterium]